MVLEVLGAVRLNLGVSMNLLGNIKSQWFWGFVAFRSIRIVNGCVGFRSNVELMVWF